jgi:hypothetical protein
MVGLSQSESMVHGKKFLENKAIQILNEKIVVKDVKEIPRQLGYYKKMQQLEKARLEKSSPNRNALHLPFRKLTHIYN